MPQVKSSKDIDRASKSASVFKTLEEGTTRIKIIGGIYTVLEHKLMVDGKLRFIACPTENKRYEIDQGLTQDLEVPACPICEKGYPASATYLAAIVDRSKDKDGNPGKSYGQFAILKKGPQIFRPIMDYFENPDWGSAGDYDFNIIAKGKGKSVKYSVQPIPKDKCEPLTDDEKSRFLAFELDNDVEKMTTPRKVEEIKKIVGDLGQYVKEEKEADIPF